MASFGKSRPKRRVQIVVMRLSKMLVLRLGNISVIVRRNAARSRDIIELHILLCIIQSSVDMCFRVGLQPS